MGYCLFLQMYSLGLAFLLFVENIVEPVVLRAGDLQKQWWLYVLQLCFESEEK